VSDSSNLRWLLAPPAKRSGFRPKQRVLATPRALVISDAGAGSNCLQISGFLAGVYTEDQVSGRAVLVP
jgi:hypothetical protein